MDVTFSSNKQDENVKHNLILENNEKQNLKRVSQKKEKMNMNMILPKFVNFTIKFVNYYIKALGIRNKKVYTIDYQTELTNNADSYSLFNKKL